MKRVLFPRMGAIVNVLIAGCAGWQVADADGELRRVASGGDLMTRDMYQNFDLSLEWKISPAGDMIRVLP